jgi:hypothetical protein
MSSNVSDLNCVCWSFLIFESIILYVTNEFNYTKRIVCGIVGGIVLESVWGIALGIV